MDLEALQQVADIVGELGEQGKSAFIWYLMVSFSKTVIGYATAFGIFAVISKQIRKAFQYASETE